MIRSTFGALVLAVPVSLAHAQTLDEVMKQNDGRPNGLTGTGVPPSFSWYAKGSGGQIGPRPSPAEFTSLTGWAQAFPQKGKPHVNCKLILSDFKTYAHKRTGGWTSVQPSSADMAGGHFVSDFKDNAGVPLPMTRVSQTVWSMPSPVGRNNHWWPIQRAEYAPNSIDGAFSTMKLRTNNPACNIVATVGVDWWRTPSAPYIDGFSNNPSLGATNWVKILNSDTSVTYTNFTAAQLRADPPPGLIVDGGAPRP